MKISNVGHFSSILLVNRTAAQANSRNRIKIRDLDSKFEIADLGHFSSVLLVNRMAAQANSKNRIKIPDLESKIYISDLGHFRSILLVNRTAAQANSGCGSLVRLAGCVAPSAFLPATGSV